MDIYVVVIGMLFLLAVFDLINGVSNDASNFLNSAVGSRAFGFKFLIAIAAAGILIGASFSSGMMDVARHGIFQPQHFTFAEIMAICAGAMLTDVILLDIFNMLGLPTSTTVSMVFELLGGTFSLSLIKLHRGAGELSLGDLVNSEKALSVIIAIFTSVAVAFVFGWIVQWISRVVWTFRYKPREKYFIAVFGGISLSAIFYFVLFQGLKGSAIAVPEVLAQNRLGTFLGSFLVFAALSELLFLLKRNVFKLIVAAGTFSLALSFAGNDLVNFIGVPLTGLSAFMAYAESGLSADQAMMTALCASEKSLWWILSLAGVIMAVSLATSRKARNVIRTSVSLSSQSSSEELFGTSPIARAFVRYADLLSSVVRGIVPFKIRNFLNRRLDARRLQLEESDAAFDLLRASVNLMLASILISLGTFFKLPLSTTYVTFMVAMGSSLADKAWGRESAVYRITGVFSVVGGWFFTAFAAFVCAFMVSGMIFWGGIPVAFLLFGLVVCILVRSSVRYRKKEKEKEAAPGEFQTILEEKDSQKILPMVQTYYSKGWGWFLVFVEDSVLDTLKALANEDLETLRYVRQRMKQEYKTLHRLRHEGFACSQKMFHEETLAKKFFLYQANDFAMSLYFSLERVHKPCLNHVDNHLTPLGESQKKVLLELAEEMRDGIEDSARMILENDYSDYARLQNRLRALGTKIVGIRKTAMQQKVPENQMVASVNLLFLTVLYECRAILDATGYLNKSSKKMMTDLV
ncbi:inorganic phosphate transporter [Fibrobacter intestinalis]|uniref:inorganic phosphate transporter n=1 Tax=Fibrobacter intestinalis TaxID=28122 RepID=UPI0023F0E351|nr:inorganic phosphate transporter [Fibrobacter intestinalis]MDD7297973.1 inorganic phosphate transporter [Fibrobacter intestinalis]